MKFKFQVENIRCDGCANIITNKLREIDGVEDVDVNVEEKQVIVTTLPIIGAEVHHTLSKALLKLGYPEVGTIGANNLRSKATSVISCAIGKVSNKN